MGWFNHQLLASPEMIPPGQAEVFFGFPSLGWLSEPSPERIQPYRQGGPPDPVITGLK